MEGRQGHLYLRTILGGEPQRVEAGVVLEVLALPETRADDHAPHRRGVEDKAGRHVRDGTPATVGDGARRAQHPL